MYVRRPMLADRRTRIVDSVDLSTRPIRASLVTDIVVAILATVSIALISTQIEVGEGDRALDAIAYAAIVVAGAALAGRRRKPLATVLIVTAALAVYLARGYVGGPIFVVYFIALFSVATAWERGAAFTVAVLTAGVLVVVGEIAGTGPGLVHLVFVGWAAAMVFLGDAMRSRRAHLAGLEERARQLEQSRDEEMRRRLMEERLQIARDLHDGVAHSMSTINVQAGTAAHVIDRHPEQGKEALTIIQRASRDALDELHALLGVLRLDPDERPERRPTPDLSQLDALVATTRRAGVAVRLSVTTRVDDIQPPLSVAAYRIVQESLTNVVRHAGSGAAATVTVAGDAGDGFAVEIVDDGGTGEAVAPSTGPGAGVGIRGMRERVETSGGSFSAGAGAGGGFRVRASWPRRQAL